ncbi:MAG: HTH domain-containing protein [Bacteroidales bacterium]|jgi:biotin operon repressor|nr:HTH domain-containing protein [Bacteroidales bacterium]
MAKRDKNILKERISRLAELKSTGTPAELAARLDISERSVKRLISEMRKSGKDIKFSQIRNSYETDENFA